MIGTTLGPYRVLEKLGEGGTRMVRVDTITGTRTPVGEIAPPDRSGLVLNRVDQWEDDGRYYTYQYERMLATLYVVSQRNR